jgi:pyridoxine kinase
MAKILTLSSQVVFGPVGNTAAVPPMLAMGHEVMQVPTIILSHHPGHGKPSAQHIGDEAFASLLASIDQVGALENLNAVMTGYFASRAQIAESARLITLLRKRLPDMLVLVDPVIGDGDALYVPETNAVALRDVLLPLATIATPNAFELSWLTKGNTSDLSSATAAALELGPSEVIATSVPAPDGKLATLLVTAAEVTQHLSLLKPQVPHGTGDYLAGCYLSHRLNHTAPQAFVQAMRKLEQAIAASSGSALNVTR